MKSTTVKTTSAATTRKTTTRTVTLASSPPIGEGVSLVNTPGMIRWARAGYRHRPDEMINLIVGGWSVSRAEAKHLLSCRPDEMTIDHDKGTIAFQFAK